MDSPFGHNNRHHHTSHHHRREEEEEERRQDQYPPPNFQQPPPPYSGGFVQEPPPPYSGGGIGGFVHEPPPPYSGGGIGGFVQEPPPPYSGGGGTHHRHEPPPPQFSSNYGGGEFGYGHNPPPPPQPDRYEYDNTPPPTRVEHVSHEVGHHRPAPPPEYGGHGTGSGGGYGFGSNRPSVRIFTKAETSYSLTIRNGQVVLAPADPRDEHQHWIKDEKWSTKVKDGEGHPSFSLVNKATGQAIKHSVAATQPVQLVPYDQNAFDESVLWAESKDLGDTYRCIRMVNNIKLNLDALNGDREHGGVRDGTVAVLWEWKKGDNQRWKIAPY